MQPTAKTLSFPYKYPFIFFYHSTINSKAQKVLQDLDFIIQKYLRFNKILIKNSTPPFGECYLYLV